MSFDPDRAIRHLAGWTKEEARQDLRADEVLAVEEEWRLTDWGELVGFYWAMPGPEYGMTPQRRYRYRQEQRNRKRVFYALSSVP